MAISGRYRIKVWESNKKEKYLYGDDEGYLGIKVSSSLITFQNHTLEDSVPHTSVMTIIT